jgi:SAM-dependent methyltransferase
MRSLRTPQEEALLQSVRDYYGTPESLKYYADLPGRVGLWACEQAMIDQFMTAPATVLDIGCGAGREAFELTRMGFKVHGIDVTPGLLEEARRIAAELSLGLEFTQCDGTTLDFPDGSFDYVLMMGQMIHYVPGRSNRVQLLNEAGRVVKQGATILLTYHDWDIQKDHAPWGMKDGRHCREPRPNEIPQHLAPLEPGDRFTRDCQGTLTDVYGFIHDSTRTAMEQEVRDAGLKILARASFETIGAEIDHFWKPTQILILRAGKR